MSVWVPSHRDVAVSDQVIKGSGLDKIVSMYDLSIDGADSLVTVNGIKRAT